MNPELAVLVDRALSAVLRDVGGTNSHRYRTRLITRDLSASAARHPAALEDLAWLEPHEDQAFLMCTDESEMRLTGSSYPELLVEIASRVQDTIVDATGSPWPVTDSGRVLDPLIVDGVAQWSDRAGWMAPIGALTSC